MANSTKIIVTATKYIETVPKISKNYGDYGRILASMSIFAAVFLILTILACCVGFGRGTPKNDKEAAVGVENEAVEDPSDPYGIRVLTLE